jgi:hypothetical protein
MRRQRQGQPQKGARLQGLRIRLYSSVQPGGGEQHRELAGGDEDEAQDYELAVAVADLHELLPDLRWCTSRVATSAILPNSRAKPTVHDLEKVYVGQSYCVSH